MWGLEEATSAAPATDSYPGLSALADLAFDSTIEALYGGAALDAVASVGEAYLDTALRLAIFLSPIVSGQEWRHSCLTR